MRRAALALPLALAACGPITNQVRDGIMTTGITRAPATCMAKHMTDRLTILQLRRLASLGNLQGATFKTIREMPRDKLMHNVRALNDPIILAVVSAAYVNCGGSF